MSSAACLTICLSQLERISLPELVLPLATFEEVDEDRVSWGIQYYVYASVAHYRAILRGFLQIADEANWACANILARHLFEWAAHASFAKLKLASLVRLKNWEKSWAILLKINGGNLYIRRFGSKYLGQEGRSVQIPEPYMLADILSVYDNLNASEDGDGAAKEDHSLLSELSHASAACFVQHTQVSESRMAFCEDSGDLSPLDRVAASTIDWLMNIVELASCIDEMTIRPLLVATMRKIIEAERQS